MEEKKKKIVNTNLGILLICLFSSIFTMADFLIIDHVLDKYFDYSKCECSKCGDNNLKLDDNKDNTSVVEEKKDDDQVAENRTYSYEDIVGVYYANVVYNGDYDMTVELSLNDDYTFVYSHNYPSGHRIYGNYVIEGDSIILNYLYSTGTADASLVGKNHKNVLKINSDFSLIDSDKESTPAHFNVDSVTLLKDTEGKFEVRTFDAINKLLKNKGIYEIDLFKDITC